MKEDITSLSIYVYWLLASELPAALFSRYYRFICDSTIVVANV